MANPPRSRKSSDAKGNSSASKKFKGQSDATPAPTSEEETMENSPESQSSESDTEEETSDVEVAVSEPVAEEPTVGEDAPVEAVTPIEEPASESVAAEPTVGEDAPVEAVTPISEPLTDDAVVEQAKMAIAPTTEPVTDDAIIEQVLEELPTVSAANQPLTDDAVVGEALEQLTASQPASARLTDDAIVQSVMEDIPGTDEAIVAEVAAYSGFGEPEMAAPTSSPAPEPPQVRQPSVNIDEAYELFRNNESVTTEASPVEVVDDSPTQPLDSMKEEVLAFLSQLPENLGSFFTEYKRPLTTVGLIIAFLITFKVLVGLVDIVNEIPLVKPTFETVGLGYSAWFIYRYLLKAETRKELGADFQVLKEEVLGKKS